MSDKTGRAMLLSVGIGMIWGDAIATIGDLWPYLIGAALVALATTYDYYKEEIE